MRKSLNLYLITCLLGYLITCSLECFAGGGTTSGGGPSIYNLAMANINNTGSNINYDNGYMFASTEKVKTTSEIAMDLADEYIDNLETPLQGIYEGDYEITDWGSHIELMLENEDNCKVFILYYKKTQIISKHAETCL